MPRITGGSLGSRKLRSPKGTHVRPTPGRVKESLFSILMPRLAGARVLDLFAGTGAIGFEAASRGASRVVSVEGQREIAHAIEDAVKSLGVEDVVTVFPAPAERARQTAWATEMEMRRGPPAAGQCQQRLNLPLAGC